MKTIDISYGAPQTYTVDYEQYEENFRDIAVCVVDGDGAAYDLSAYSARLAGYKPDTHLVYRTGTIVANCIHFDVSQQMTAVATTTGYALNLVLISADKRETLVTILFKVKAAAVQDADIVSTDDINVLDNITAAQLAEIQAFIAEAYKTSDWAAYKTAAETARDAAAGSAAAASNSATAAAGSALAASNSAGSASYSETEATEKAGEASASAEQASASAEQASDSASEASGSAEAALDAKGVCEDKAREVSTNATAAVTASRNAAESESSARGSADTASKAATAAATSVTNAAASETTAKQQAEIATQKEEAAAISKSDAEGAAIRAKASEDAAAEYAAQAAGSSTITFWIDPADNGLNITVNDETTA